MSAKKLITPFSIALFFYVLAVLLIFPFGNHPTNDDWIFVRQVEHFLQGNYKLSALIDPAFIAQGALGSMWALVFGFSFTSLKILTVFMGAFLLWGVYKLFENTKVGESVLFAVLLLVIFNPIIFSSIPTFMTEVYFLAFFVWSLYFYQKALRNNVVKSMIVGSLCCGLSILIRQIGIVTYIAFVLSYIVSCKKRSFSSLLIATLPVIVSFFVYVHWPSYAPSKGVGFLELKSFWSRVKGIIWIGPYLSYFLLPFLLAHGQSLGRKSQVALLMVSLPLAVVLFKRDIFPLGSVFYIEGLHAKTGFRSNLSIFDSVLLKILLAYLVSLGVCSLVHFLVVEFKSFSKQPFITLNVLGMLGVLFITNDFYDRYLLAVFIPLLLLISLKLSVPLSKVSKITLAFMVFATIVLTHEYFAVQNLKWNQALALQKDTGLKAQIFLDGTYTKYVSAVERNDYTGLVDLVPGGLSYKCFVEDYTLDSGNFVSRITRGFEAIRERYMENPKIYNCKKLEGMPRIKNHLSELLYNREYFSLLYNLVGKKAFVGSFCVEE